MKCFQYHATATDYRFWKWWAVPNTNLKNWYWSFYFHKHWLRQNVFLDFDGDHFYTSLFYRFWNNMKRMNCNLVSSFHFKYVYVYIYSFISSDIGHQWFNGVFRHKLLLKIYIYISSTATVTNDYYIFSFHEWCWIYIYIYLDQTPFCKTLKYLAK